MKGRAWYLKSSVATILCLLFIHGAQANELIRNGDFSEVLWGWGLPGQLGGRIPFDADMQAVYLDPDLSGSWSSAYDGTVVFQPLNLPVSQNQTLELGVDLRLRWGGSGHTLSVYLEYLDGEGNRQRERVLYPDNEEISTEEWRRFTATHLVPADRVKLVGIALDRAGWDDLYARKISLTAGTPAAAVPELNRVSPAAVEYGDTVVLRGSGFGADEGIVLIGGSAEGVEILAWSDDEIQVHINDPCVGGAVRILADGVQTWQSRRLRVSSPFYSLTLKASQDEMMFGPMMRILPGQPLRLGAFVRFFNGYETEEGVALSLLEPEAPAVFNRELVFGNGGSVFTVDTAGWEPGFHTVVVEADDGELLPRTAAIDVEVVDVDDIVWRLGGDPLEGQVLDEQGSQYMGPVFLRDEEEVNAWGMWDALQLSSSDPTAAATYFEPFGGFDLLIYDSAGNVTLTTTLPDGRTFDTSFSIEISEPNIVSSGLSYSTMPNTPGAMTNFFNFTGSDEFSQRNASWGADFQQVDLGGSGSSGYWSFTAGDFLNPGQYLISAGGTIAGEEVHHARVLNVTNDPATGMFEGSVLSLDGDGGHGHGLSGTLELFDAETGDLVQDFHVWSDDPSRYMVSRIPPGEYRLRWVGDWGDTRWHPGGASFEEAETVVVTAGSAFDTIDFLMVSPPREPPQIATVDLDETGAHVHIPAEEDNIEFELQRSTTLRDHSWIKVDEGWSWEGEVELQDSETGLNRAYYRVLSR